MTKPNTSTRAVAMRLRGYPSLLNDIKQRIRTAQIRTVMAGNASLLHLYWDIGGILAQRQIKAGWGAAVLPRLATDLHHELPEVKGFSERNLRRMIQFRQEYPTLFPELLPNRSPSVTTLVPKQKSAARSKAVAIRTPPVTKLTALQQAITQITWAHNLILIQQVKSLPTRLWYAQQATIHGWSRDVLSRQIQSQAHKRQGKAITNFAHTLPPPQSDLAAQLLKDPYLFDFLTLDEPFHERELETGLLRHLQDFLVELGTGFAFVGRQVHVAIGGDDFYIDLLFYHLRLRCYVVIDLKIGAFKAEYAGKMNFYLNAVDDRMRHATDQPSIGLILCENNHKIIAEYALRGLNKAIGVSAYQFTRALPKKLQSVLPSIAQLEKELSQNSSTRPTRVSKKQRRS